MASCYCPGELERGIREKILSPIAKGAAFETKLMHTVFNGGKAYGSAVKFSKFYLLVEAHPQNPDQVMECFLKFQQALVKQIASTKLGLAGFKASSEGSFFNACANINESFKWIEDAIVQSGANADGKV